VIGALGFLTVVGRASPPSASTLRWFPLTGALVGTAVGSVWWGADRIWPAGLAAAIAVAADLLVTGMLHLDGLADTADGVLPHLERGRRLDVMATPDVGAFGVGVVVATLLLRWTAFASFGPDVLVVAGLWCASRTLMAVAVRSLPYARAEGGLALAFGGPAPALGLVAGGSILAIALAAAGEGGPGAAAVAAAAVAGVGVLALGRARLGGYTGDVLGAAGLVAETVGLVVAAASW
jgi:adenosylcobinamide-GDP ribazoletransferase